MRVVVAGESAVFCESLAGGLRAIGLDRVVVVHGLNWLDRAVAYARHVRVSTVIVQYHDGLPDRLFPELVTEGATPFAIIDGRSAALARRCLAGGAAGVFVSSQPVDELVQALHDAIRGVTRLTPGSHRALAGAHPGPRTSRLSRLTPAERSVLALIARGSSVTTIAGDRGVSIHTVRAQVRSILQKLGVNSQIAAVAMLSEEAERMVGPAE